MTVSTTTYRADYTGNGSTTVFTVPFYFIDPTHIIVYRTQISTGIVTTLALTTNYTVSGTGVSTGGSITTLVAPTSDQKISILRNVPLTQQTHYTTNDPFPAASHETALDTLCMQVQQISEVTGRSFTLSPSTSGISTTFPAPVANYALGWDSTATSLTNIASASQISAASTNATAAAASAAAAAASAAIINPNRQNILVNGNFDIMQRYEYGPGVGAGLSLNNGDIFSIPYADCWIVGGTASANGIFHITTYNVRTDQASGYSKQAVYVSNATNLSALYFENRIEDAGTMGGRYVYASAYIAGSGTYNFQLTQNFGTGGSPSSAVTLTSSNVTVPSSYWLRVGALFQLGSISGKTFGTNNNSYLSFKVTRATVGDSTVYISDCQLEESAAGISSPTVLGRRLIAQEHNICQRYFEKSYDGTYGNIAGAHQTTAATASILSNGTIRYKATKAFSPTISIFSPNDSTSGVVAEYNTSGTFVANRTASIVNNCNTGFTVQVASATVGNNIRFHWFATAEF